jgi:hypothetical protein
MEIYIESGPMAGQHFLLTEERPQIVLGRCEGGVQVDVDLASYGSVVSRRHAQLRLYGSEVALADLGSRNGTSIDGTSAPANQEVLIPVGTRIHLAPPGGPSLIVRAARSAWGDGEEELTRLRTENRELRAAYESLRKERDALAARTAPPQDAPAPRVGVGVGVGVGIDWEASQRTLSECRANLDELRVLLSELSVDGRARSLLTKALTRLGDVMRQLRQT